MLSSSPAFSSFSTDDVAAAARFYGDVLGLDVETMDAHGPMLPMLWITSPTGGRTLVYEKPDHTPASHTVMMFPVDDVDAVAAGLRDRGVALEYLDFSDEDGVARGGDGDAPATAWFKDPAGNWLSVIEDR